MLRAHLLFERVFPFWFRPFVGESGKLHIKALWLFCQQRSLQKFLVVIFVVEL